MKCSIVLLLAAIAAPVNAVTISSGNAGGAVDHVRFSAAPDATGMDHTGWFNSDASIAVNFSSSNSLEVQNGEMSLGGLNNTTFQDLTFSLGNGGTFNKAVVNPDASVDGTIISMSPIWASPRALLLNPSR